MPLFYIDIHFSSSINEEHLVDTRFCTHDLIKEDDWNDPSCTKKKKKIMIALHVSIHSFHIIKNDLEILTVTTMCPVFKSDHQIERYRMIKFTRLACIVSR